MVRPFLTFYGLEAIFGARQWSTRPSGPLALAEPIFSGSQRHAPFFQNTKEALPLEWQGCLLLTGLFAVLGVGDPDAGYD